VNGLARRRGGREANEERLFRLGELLAAFSFNNLTSLFDCLAALSFLSFPSSLTFSTRRSPHAPRMTTHAPHTLDTTTAPHEAAPLSAGSAGAHSNFPPGEGPIAPSNASARSAGSVRQAEGLVCRLFALLHCRERGREEAFPQLTPFVCFDRTVRRPSSCHRSRRHRR
jgi:hypothetical protein